jgi:NADPH:quinone reductase-like Zn-dependent oxidoreductase
MLHEIPATHRAWRWYGKGEPQSLRLEEMPIPIPGAGEVLIANRAIGVNPVDWKMIEEGSPDWGPGHVPGVDGSGEIVALGEGINLCLGTRVAYHQSLTRDGSFAEYVCLREESLLTVPEGLSDDMAACLPCPGLTAWQALSKVPARADRDVLVTGAGGAVGLLLTQFALQRHWRVWVTAAPAHHGRLLSSGIAGAFDYRDADWMKALQCALGPRKLYAAFDTVSGEQARLLASMVGYNGHLVCIQDRLETSPVAAFSSAVSLHEVALNSAYRYAVDQDWREWRAAGVRMLRKLLLGGLRLPAVQRFAFDELPRAVAALKNRTIAGKLVIQHVGSR